MPPLNCKQCGVSVDRGPTIHLRVTQIRNYGNRDGEVVVDAGLFHLPECVTAYLAENRVRLYPVLASGEEPF